MLARLPSLCDRITWRTLRNEDNKVILIYLESQQPFVRAPPSRPPCAAENTIVEKRYRGGTASQPFEWMSGNTTKWEITEEYEI